MAKILVLASSGPKVAAEHSLLVQWLEEAGIKSFLFDTHNAKA